MKKLHKLDVQNIYVHLDGPRQNNSADHKSTSEVLEVVESFRLKFPNFQLNQLESNLGCGQSVAHGISWFFSKNSRGIIIEDDILPSKNFLYFAQESLDHYEDRKDIWHINGWSPNSKSIGCHSAFETRFAIPWGWATWADRWNSNVNSLFVKSDIKPSRMKTNLQGKLLDNFDEYWSNNFSFVDSGNLDTWDYQWIRSIWIAGGKAISPPFRMTSNIGFDRNSTHTFRPNRSQIPKFDIYGEWNFDDCQNSYMQDWLLGELTYNVSQKRFFLVSSIKLRFKVISKSSKESLIMRIYKSLFMREILCAYFSLKGTHFSIILLLRPVKRLSLKMKKYFN